MGPGQVTSFELMIVVIVSSLENSAASPHLLVLNTFPDPSSVMFPEPCGGGGGDNNVLFRAGLTTVMAAS